MDNPYRQYFQESPCYLTILDRDLKIIDANYRFEKDFGPWRGRYCYQVYKGESERCEHCLVEQTLLDGHGHSAQDTLTRLDGTQTTCVVNTVPILDDSGDMSGVMKMSTDITPVTRVTSQFRESKVRYQQLFNEVPCYVSIQDQDLNIVEVNRRFKEDFGSYLGCKCHEIYKHRSEVCLPCPVQQTFEDGQVHSSEEVVTSRNGDQMHVLVYTAPIFDSMGLISRVMEMSTDITPIRKLQSQLESIGLLIGSVSHGIKGLLNGLDGGMYLVNTGMKKGDEDRIQKGWEMVQRNVDRIRTQVLNILYYSKEREPGLETVSAMEFAKDIGKLIEPKALELNIEFQRHINPKVGTFEADPQAMRSLLVNLLENALDACRVDKNKQKHLVSFSADGDAKQVHFEISDNGIGMDRETREKAFSLFFSSKGAKGTGLGLFISNNIVKAHGGYIEVVSEPEKGTSFNVFIPRKNTVNEKQLIDETQ
jgi:PAS domain S-box-containing protein